MGQITLFDYLLLPLYLWLIFKIAYYYRDKYYPKDHPYQPYFIPALSVKIGGAIFIGLIYNYYYDGGDTFNFFYHSQVINSTFLQSPQSWFMLITHQTDTSNMIEAKALSEMYWFDDIPAYVTSCIGAFIGLFCFTKYLEINIIVACLSFMATWLMFTVFAEQYPKLIKYIAIAVFFMPGPAVWGSGLFKDSFCIISICGLVYGCYSLFEKGKLSVWLPLYMAVSILLLLVIKAYILILLLPIILFKIFLVYRKRLAIRYKGNVFYYAIVTLVTIGALFVLRRAAGYIQSAVTIEATLETIKHQKDYLLEVSIQQDGSAYDLGDFDPTMISILGKFWPAVNVTLFRPYIWESRSIIQIFNSVESLFMLLLTAYLFVSRNIFKTIKNLLTDANLIMCLLFALSFAFVVGISTYNFGSLSRYKIPCTPFYMLLILILLFKDKPVTAAKPTVTVTNDPEIPPGVIPG